MEGKISQNGTDLSFKIGEEDYSFLSRIIPGFAKDFVGILNDRVRERRAERQIALLKKWHDKIKESGK